MHFGVLLIAGMLTSTLPVPLQLAGVAFLVAAIVVGIVALRAVWRSGVRGSLPIVLATGLGLAAVMTLSSVALLALWPVQAERQECLRDALTISAREACEAQFQDSLDDLVERVQRPAGQD